MQHDLQNKLSVLENAMKIQRDCIHPGSPEADYMHGMLNGMIYAYSVLCDARPRYYVLKNEKRIRYRKKK